MRNDVCCCGIFSVTHGSRILSLFTIMGGLAVIYNSACRSRASTTMKFIGVVIGLSLILAGGFAIHAVKARKPKRMFPIIGVQAIALLFTILYIAAFVFAFIRIVEVSICIILSVVFLVALWFFSIHFNTYRYLKEFESKGFGPSAVDSYGV
ncbi:hypothetical protein PRIPAC_80512 [Pristionchus pacificus]|uniref:Uncharacterized protein n=1 Tax=Pristionchus pacificus TaxID=54126 RepID=A0A2A6BH33_PRIPA|nr:hypothetical protein PRIPAC_80512 [Pristionchus pacificus]|eukprot:PDM65235.1 hypothetical protein PRIPAC_52177 [Pristionchus pacificus]